MLWLILACQPGKVVVDSDEIPDSVVLDDTGTPDSPVDPDDTQPPDDSTPVDDTDTGIPVEEDPPDWVVDCHGAGDFDEIQDAIEAATSGDTIAVQPCVYKERLDFLGKSLDVYGIEGSSETILDAEYGGTAVNFENGEGEGSRFAGFTVIHGQDETNGGGVEIYYAVATLQDLVFEDMGDSLRIVESQVGFLDMADVDIDGSGLLEGGAAIYADGGGLTATRLNVECGDADSALWHHVSLELTDSTINCRDGVGIWNYHGEMFIQRSRISADDVGIYTYDTESTEEEPDNPNERIWIWNSLVMGESYGIQALYQELTIVNSVIWSETYGVSMTLGSPSTITNSVVMNAECGLSSDTSFTIQRSDFYGNETDVCGITGSATMNVDPEFEDFPDDLHLQSGSPLIDAGQPGGEWEDTDGTRNDIGVYGGPRPITD